MDENESERKSRFFSEPDENGVRYYKVDAVRNAKKGKGGALRNSLIVFVCIIVGVVTLGIVWNNMFPGGAGEVKLPSGDYIATIYVEGTIASENTDTWGNPFGYQHNWTLLEINRLMSDANNRGLIVYVDSPGGGVYESDELYFKIKEYQEKTGRPVYAAMASMAASGGYYVSAPADKIFANRNCWTGSIGVTIGTLIDVSGFLENYGIKTETIDSGANKSMGSYFAPLTEDQKDIFQSLVDEAYDQFTEIVAHERGMDIEDVREIADGRLYTAKQAAEIGLVDVVGTYGEAVADMREEYELYGCEVVDIVWVYKSWLPSLLGSININTGGEASAVLGLLEKQNRFPVSYICEALARF